MAEIQNKENISPRRSTRSPLKQSLESPAKVARDSRRKSIGPGAEAQESHKTSSPAKNRRQSSFAPTVRSILPSREDEAKRREARRKSLANRRVSFAPEATLHTWDVIEYMREATTSSTGSEVSRRQSGYEEQEDTVPATPDDQLRAQQKKRRRSSVIPPLNFNDPEDAYSSSPVSGSSPASAEDDNDEDVGSDDIDEQEEYDEGSSMSLISADNTANLTIQSNISNAASDSSAQLTARLEQAATIAGTRGPFYDEFGYVQAVSPAVSVNHQQDMLTPMAKNLIALQEQENVNPFSPAFRHAASIRPSTILEEDEDVSMDMTRAVGGINSAREDQTESLGEDISMDFTQVVGKIHQPSPEKSPLKRRRSTTDTGSPMPTMTRPSDGEGLGRSTKRRRSSRDRLSAGDATMDFTTAFGGVVSPSSIQESPEATMDFTVAVGNIVKSRSPAKVARRQSVRRRRSSVQSALSADESMDFTTAVGAIKQAAVSPAKSQADHSSLEISMDLTVALGNVNEEVPVQSRPITPRQFSSPLRENAPTTPSHDGALGHGKIASPAKKLITPSLERMVESSVALTPVANAMRSTESSARKRTPKIETRASVSPNRTPLKLPPPINADVQTPQLSPEQNLYPQLPEPKTVLVATPSPQRVSRSLRSSPTKIEKSPERSFLQPEKAVPPQKGQATPEIKTHAPSGPAKLTPKKEATVAAPNMLDNIRTMATPRKETNATPLKRLKDMTPKKTPVRTPLVSKLWTPRAATTPRVQFEMAQEEPVSLEDDGSQALTEDLRRSLENPAELVMPVTLNNFLDLAGVKFMDLTATKRRYTAAPTPFKSSAGQVEGAEASFEDSVTAGACVVPELELYQHSCRELKRYMSEGKVFLKQLEAEVAANPPPFLKVYMSASTEQRATWDRLIADAKTRARLHSKELWYGWRSQLLVGLEDGLRGIEKGLDADASELRRRRQEVDEVLPAAESERQKLENERATLQDLAYEHSAEDKQALKEAREELVQVEAALEQRRETIAQLKAELEEKDRDAELLIDAKSEASASIAELNRVKEASRTMSKEEMASYQASTAALTRKTGWAITSATPSSLTMTYRSSLQLFFNPASFLPTDTAKSPSRRAAASPISLSYIAPAPLSTEKRFFLQLLRAQLQMLDPACTTARALLAFVAAGWDTALGVARALARLALEQPLDVRIRSDETLGVHASLLLPAVRTMVRLEFEIRASVVEDGPEMRLDTAVSAGGRVVYGEAYKEDKMAEFLGQRVGRTMLGADVAVRELRMRLERTGRKG